MSQILLIISILLVLIKSIDIAKYQQHSDIEATDNIGNPTGFYFQKTTDKTNMNNFVIYLGDMGKGMIGDELADLICKKQIQANPPPTMNVFLSGPTSNDCKFNPTYCGYNKVQLTVSDNAYWLGDGDYTTPKGNKCQFKGQKILASMIKDLGKLGLDKAENIIFTSSTASGGTGLILNIDKLSFLVNSISKDLKKIGAIPQDGIHSNQQHVVFTGLKTTQSWLSQLTKILPSMDKSLYPECLDKNTHEDKWKCLYTPEILEQIKTPLFPIQSTVSVYDEQCLLNDRIQFGWFVSCNPNDNKKYQHWHLCFEYNNKCSSEQVTGTINPLQKVIHDAQTNALLDKKHGFGGFFHSCHLGALLQGIVQNKAVWQLVTINSISAQQAVDQWWTDTDQTASHQHFDGYWDATSKLFPNFQCNNACNNPLFPPYMDKNIRSSLNV